jgi:hypothetical protein
LIKRIIKADNEVVSDLENESDSDNASDFDLDTSNENDIQKKNIENLICDKNKSNWDSMKINKNLCKLQTSKKNSLASNQSANEEEAMQNNFKSTDLIKLKNTKINQGVLQGLNIFHRKSQEGFVDVWWLFDDGGLTLLLSHLIMQRKNWYKCKLRIFIQTKSEDSEISEEQRK